MIRSLVYSNGIVVIAGGGGTAKRHAVHILVKSRQDIGVPAEKVPRGDGGQIKPWHTVGRSIRWGERETLSWCEYR
jgi:hypothetical protein